MHEFVEKLLKSDSVELDPESYILPLPIMINFQDPDEYLKLACF